MNIRGLQKTSLIDYPGKISSTIFVGGCNLRCSYCYNKDLVLRPETLPLFIEDEVLAFLRKRTSFLDGVCISGGEPTIQEDLPVFIEDIKSLGLKVKLDTNGMNPELINYLLENDLLDYIAIDIKAPFPKYNLVTGVSVDITNIKNTIALVKENMVEYEFRTTIVPALIDKDDIINIAQELRGSSKMVLQRFIAFSNVQDFSWDTNELFPPEEIPEVAQQCLKHVSTVELRGF